MKHIHTIFGCLYFWIFILYILLPSCEKDKAGIPIEKKDTFATEITDTTTVYTATYQFSPLPTSGQGIIIIGKINDDIIGNIAVNSYFKIGKSSLSEIANSTAVFDSITLELPYSGYYYGDTTNLQTIKVHRVLEKMELVKESSAWEFDEIPVFSSGSALFSNNEFRYDESVLGSKIFKPTPNKITDTVSIKLNKTFGEDLWTKAQSSSIQIINSDEFENYLKGFVLTSGNNSDCLLGFNTDSILVNLHYSYIRDTDGKKVNNKVSMKVEDNSFQFNELQIDRSQTVFKALDPNKIGELSSEETDNQVVVQGLTGLVTKVKFPYLEEFMNSSGFILSKAELIVETSRTTQVPFMPPSSLILMVADKNGSPSSILTNGYVNSDIQNSYLMQDDSGGTQTGKYTFDLTQYISDFRGAIGNNKKALYLSLPVSDLTTKAERLIVSKNGNKPAIALKLIYTKYQSLTL